LEKVAFNMSKKAHIINYRRHLIELHQSEGGWSALFRKFAHVEFTDVGQLFPTKKEALAHAKRHVDWEINEEIIASQFKNLFDQLLQEGYPLALIFEGLTTALDNEGWQELSGLLEEVAKISPGSFR
jgi:hypothetical protein